MRHIFVVSIPYEKYLFFDCETTGLFDGTHIPRLLQLGWLIADSEFNVILEKEFLIVPDGFSVPAEATAINGITEESARSFGRSCKDVLSEFFHDLDGSGCVVAHNFEYDSRIIEYEASRFWSNFSFGKYATFCTMRSSADFCKIPGPYGYKWAKLSELYEILFGRLPAHSHHALDDAKTCAECFFELKKRGLIMV